MNTDKTKAYTAAVLTQYSREYQRYSKLAELVARRCQRLLEANTILATVDWRAKSPASLQRKLERVPASIVDDEGAWLDPLLSISDLAGVRIKTYAEVDRHKVVEDIRLAFEGPGEGGEVEVEVKDDPSRHYRAIHCQVTLPRGKLSAADATLHGASCEIQVCSLLAHVWNEIEHNLVYKATDGQPSAEEVELLAALGSHTRDGDEILNSLLSATRRRLAQSTGEFTDAFDFAARMRGRFPLAHNFEMHALALLEELRAFGLTTPESIDSHLVDADCQTESDSLIEAFGAYQVRTSDWGVVLDPGSSDRLLVLLLARRAPEILRRHQTGTTRGRLPRIARLARRFVDMGRDVDLAAKARDGDNALTGPPLGAHPEGKP